MHAMCAGATLFGRYVLARLWGASAPLVRSGLGAKTPLPSLYATSQRSCIVREKLMSRSSYSCQKHASI